MLAMVGFFEADGVVQSFSHSFIVRHANMIVSALLTDKGPFSDFPSTVILLYPSSAVEE